MIILKQQRFIKHTEPTKWENLTPHKEFTDKKELESYRAELLENKDIHEIDFDYIIKT